MDTWEEARPRPLAAAISHALSDFHDETSANKLFIILRLLSFKNFSTRCRLGEKRDESRENGREFFFPPAPSEREMKEGVSL